MARVELKGVVKAYGPGQPPAIPGLDLTIEHGELFVLLGPSGCGKSTVLRMIAGLETISAGELRIGDRVVNDVAPKDRDIAMVFQSYALYPHMTVRENLGFGLRMRGTPRGEVDRRAVDVAAQLGLSDLLERLPKQLSGGQRQRVALGRAIVREPAVFLLDEPLSNLDAKLRGSTRIELKRLHRRLGATMVYVTHDQVEAMTLGDRVAVLRDGVLQQVGTPLDVYDRPANRFVAGFLGSPPMNFAEALVEGGALAFQGGARLDVPPHLRREVATVGATLVLGVRPEDVLVEAPPPPDARPDGLLGDVAVVEALGSESVVTVDTALGPFVARVAPERTPQAGARVLLRPRPEKLHLFAVGTGHRLRQGPEVSVSFDGLPAAGEAP